MKSQNPEFQIFNALHQLLILGDYNLILVDTSLLSFFVEKFFFSFLDSSQSVSHLEAYKILSS